MSPREFLDVLWKDKPQNLFVLIWSLQDKTSHWFQDCDKAADCIERASEKDVYVGVGLAGRDYGPNRRCVGQEITAIAGLWADFDVDSEAHPNKALPPSVKDALRIVPDSLPPTITVRTGNGLHAWWLFNRPWVFASDDDRTQAADLNRRFHTVLQQRAKVFGWSYDRLSDFARILRIPGTTNWKDRDHPRPVLVEAAAGPRYERTDIARYLGDLGPSTAIADCPQWACELKGHDICVDLSARIEDKRLKQWLEADERFRATWFRQRNDLRDQSQSGYDLALACFAVDHGLSRQETTDLMVHHRALHKQKQRTTVDYFARTISTAEARWSPCPTIDATHPLGTLPSQAGIIHERSGQLPPAEAAAQRSALYDRLSRLFGVRIRAMSRVSGQSSVVHMDIDRGKVEFSNIGKLMSQNTIRHTLAGVTGKLLPRFRPKQWEQIVQMMLDACTVIDGGEEMDTQASARLRLAEYPSATPFIECIEGSGQDARKPMLDNGRITVCASDIHAFMKRTASENVTMPSVIAMLSAVGASTRRYRGKFREQSRWVLPPDQFSHDDYAPSHPEIAHADN